MAPRAHAEHGAVPPHAVPQVALDARKQPGAPGVHWAPTLRRLAPQDPPLQRSPLRLTQLPQQPLPLSGALPLQETPQPPQPSLAGLWHISSPCATASGRT